MATSIGGAAAAGLESGFGMGLRMLDQQEQVRARQRREELQEEELQERRVDRQDQRARLAQQDKRLAAQDARQVRQDQRQASLDAIKALDSEIADLGTEGSTLFQQYGGYDKVPQQLRDDFTSRVRSVRQRRDDARRRIYEPDIAEQKRDAAEKWSRIQAGQLSLDDLSDQDLYRTLTVMTRRDLSDFLAPPGGGPSRIQQAGLDLQAGLETGNQDLTLKAANVLLAPELRTGVGAPGRDGSEIVGKEIVQLVPHPEDPTQIVPIVKVTVRREDGAVGSYVAPITENRSSDPNDNVKMISMQEAFDRVGQLTTLAEALNRPDLRKRIEAGEKAGGRGQADEFLQALSSIGVKPPTKQITRDKLDLGDRVIEREVDTTGRVVGQTEYRKGATPRAFAPGGGSRRATGLAATLETIDEQIDEGVLSPEEGEDLKRSAISKAAKGSGGGVGGGGDPKSRVTDANDALALIEQARQVLPNATGSYAGRGVDEAMRFFGRSTPGAEAAAKLKAIEGALVSKMPKMSGPQSDRDVQLYRQQAALIGDDTLPVETRLEALDAVEEIQRRYAGGPAAPDTARRRSGPVTTASAEAAGGAPVQLSRDPRAAEEQFARLPSGATFIDPEGKLRRKP